MKDVNNQYFTQGFFACRKQLDGLENMYSEVLKLLGLKKYGRPTHQNLGDNKGGFAGNYSFIKWHFEKLRYSAETSAMIPPNKSYQK